MDSPPPASTPAPRDPFAGGPVPSPCINVCQIDPASGLCTGCRRTLDEIAVWSRLDDRAKRAVWMRLATRPPFPSTPR
jgi:hypothetical protein